MPVTTRKTKAVEPQRRSKVPKQEQGETAATGSSEPVADSNPPLTLMTKAEFARLSRGDRLRKGVAVVLVGDDRPTPQRVQEWRQPVSLPAGPVRFLGAGARTAVAPDAADVIPGLEDLLKGEWAPGAPLDEGAAWQGLFMLLGPDALLDAGADLVECENLRSHGTNYLSAIGGLVSAAVRRAVLRWMLARHHWDMPSVGRELRLGGTSNVLRAIKDLGLEKDLQHARSAGWIKRGGRRPKAGPPNG
ncbi:MAG: hypothetical protein JWM10_3687 [Myxococcaceae bacterium]|nr:hypothetical protein [Myxococcaceae bacterium]